MCRTMSVEPLQSTVVAQLLSPGAQLEVLESTWPAPLDITVVESDPVVELSLIPVAPNTGGYFSIGRNAGRFARLGPLYFKAASVPLRVRCPVGHARTLRCTLPRERSVELQLHDTDWQPAVLNAGLDIDDRGIRATLMQLANEVKDPGFASRMLIDAGMTLMMVNLARYLHRKQALSTQTRGGLSPNQLRRVRERIAADGPVPTICELASVAEVSNRHLTRAFKQSTGKTIGAHVQEVQLQRAKHLLLQTDFPIKAIAGQLGFSCPHNFSTAFYRATSQSPKVFRRENRSRGSI